MRVRNRATCEITMSANSSRRSFLKGSALVGAACMLRSPAPASSAGSSVIVVGAGAFGGWSALQLAQRGMRVTLVDAWGPGNSRASSGGETRTIRATYGPTHTLYVQMVARALQLWQAYQQRWNYLCPGESVCEPQKSARPIVGRTAGAHSSSVRDSVVSRIRTSASLLETRVPPSPAPWTSSGSSPTPLHLRSGPCSDSAAG